MNRNNNFILCVFLTQLVCGAVEALDCFSSNAELKDAVDAYALNPTESSSVAVQYGWPINNWCVDNLEDFSEVFNGERNYPLLAMFNEDISGWKTTSAITMYRMFYKAESFNQPIGGWITSGVTRMDGMFYGASSFNQPLEGWDTSRVTTMRQMFTDAGLFNQPLEGWNTSSVTTMYNMFTFANAFNRPLRGWDTSSVTTMYYMFGYAESFNQPLEGWNTSSVTTMQAMFSRTRLFNQPLEGWDTSRVTRMDGMFDNALSFNQPLRGWDTTSVTNMNRMFYQASSFSIDLCRWGPMLQGRTVDVRDMFSSSGCPIKTSPTLDSLPPGPFCYECASASPSMVPSSAPSPIVDEEEGLVVPPELRNDPGLVTRYFLLPIVTYSGRTQQVYSMEMFGESRKRITAISFRYQTYPETAFEATMIVKLGTTHRVPSLEMSKDLDTNLGDDIITVYNGVYKYEPKVSASPVNPFEVQFEVQEPFVFDPADGKNLILDCVTITDDEVNDFEGSFLDQDSTNKVTGVFGAAFQFPTLPADVEENFGLVTLFTYEDLDPMIKVDGVTIALKDLMAANIQLAAKFLRLVFNDCVGGCDGCVDMTHIENRGLEVAIAALEPIVETYEADGFTRADIWSLAGLVAAEYSQLNNDDKQLFPMRGYGRVNCEGDYRAGPARFIPNSHVHTSSLLDFFANEFGFSKTETVAIMGAHTIGRATQENSGFDGDNGWVTNPEVLDNEYYRVMLKDFEIDQRFMQKSVDNTAFPDYPNPQFFWRHREETEEEDVFMLNVDMALAANFEDELDPATGLVSCSILTSEDDTCPSADTLLTATVYSGNNARWLRDFRDAMVKMTENGYDYVDCDSSICGLLKKQVSTPTSMPSMVKSEHPSLFPSQNPSTAICPCRRLQILCRLRNRCLFGFPRDE